MLCVRSKETVLLERSFISFTIVDIILNLFWKREKVPQKGTSRRYLKMKLAE